MSGMDRLRAHLATLPPDYPITSARLARALAMRQQTVTTYLVRLAAAGVLQPRGETPAQAIGGRRGVIYRTTAT